LLICDHATNAVPVEINNGSLGLPEADMRRHIASDIGAAAVTRQMADIIDAPAILSNFSRLVIDPNRGEDDPTLIMQLYDGSTIPANRHISETEITRRLDQYYRPYHTALAQLSADNPQAALVSIHSFAPRLKGKSARPWHLGLLYAGDARLAKPLMARLRQDNDICVGDNEPYSGSLRGDTMDRHGLQTGRAHILIEIRNDLISDAEGQSDWARRLVVILQEVVKGIEINTGGANGQPNKT